MSGLCSSLAIIIACNNSSNNKTAIMATSSIAPPRLCFFFLFGFQSFCSNSWSCACQVASFFAVILTGWLPLRLGDWLTDSTVWLGGWLNSCSSFHNVEKLKVLFFFFFCIPIRGCSTLDRRLTDLTILHYFLTHCYIFTSHRHIYILVYIHIFYKSKYVCTLLLQLLPQQSKSLSYLTWIWRLS